MHTHSHDHHSHPHSHSHSHGTSYLPVALCLTLGFAVVELLAGFWSGSLALLGDAGHMLTDSMSLVLAVLAAKWARRAPSARHSYGLGRVETLSALANVLFMVMIVIGLSIAAWQRFSNLRAINGEAVSFVAFIGLLVNIVVAWLLMRGEQTLNTRGALLHVMGDLLGSIAALVAGLVITYTGWTPIDPMLSLLIGVLILLSSMRLLREIVHALLEGVPAHISLATVGQTLAALDKVRSVHDLHIWTLSSHNIALSAHIRLDSLNDWPGVLKRAQETLKKLGISHVTLQAELSSSFVAWPETHVQSAAKAEEKS